VAAFACNYWSWWSCYHKILLGYEHNGVLRLQQDISHMHIWDWHTLRPSTYWNHNTHNSTSKLILSNSYANNLTISTIGYDTRYFTLQSNVFSVMNLHYVILLLSWGNCAFWEIFALPSVVVLCMYGSRYSIVKTCPSNSNVALLCCPYGTTGTSVPLGTVES